MIIERPAAARGTVDLGWLRSRHSFSFGHYHDPAWMGFGPLRRAFREDRAALDARNEDRAALAARNKDGANG